MFFESFTEGSGTIYKALFIKFQPAAYVPVYDSTFLFDINFVLRCH